jgi:hypothetical protein
MASALERVRALVAAARRLADPTDVLGREARLSLPAVTRLSAQGVELALEHCLEIAPEPAELEALCASVTPAPAAHVLLSANVFVAAHRAIALALAASERVFVRPSRREPQMAELLARAAPGLFELASELSPGAGDHVFAYGRDETLRSLRAALDPGVVLHAHGAGFALAIVEPGVDVELIAERLALDIALFDQRGCLSPRALVVAGGEARPYAQALAEALGTLERRVPRGELFDEELAAIASYRDTMIYGAELLPAGAGFVGLEEGAERLAIAPVGRNCHVVSSVDPLALVGAQARHLTCIGFAGSSQLGERIAAALPRARRAAIGKLQSPPFDGPVDRRGF